MKPLRAGRLFLIRGRLVFLRGRIGKKTPCNDRRIDVFAGTDIGHASERLVVLGKFEVAAAVAFSLVLSVQRDRSVWSRLTGNDERAVDVT